MTSSASSARRFLLVPEDPLHAAPRRARVRRYQLAALGPRGGRPAGRGAPARVRDGEAPGRI